jgi:hypothetical protein
MTFFSLKNKLITVPLKYGGIGGILVILLFMIFYFLGKNPLVEIKLVDILILAVFIFFSLREFRDSHNNKELHFWQGVSGGMITYFSIAIISALFILVLLVVIDPAITTDYIQSRIQLIDENKAKLVENINEQAYLDALAGVKKTTPMDLAIDDFLKKSIIGLFLTIIIAVILRK